MNLSDHNVGHAGGEWREGEHRDCEVIERRVAPGGVCQYYVHYVDFNRRLDEWVDAERLQALERIARRVVQVAIQLENAKIRLVGSTLG